MREEPTLPPLLDRIALALVAAIAVGIVGSLVLLPKRFEPLAPELGNGATALSSPRPLPEFSLVDEAGAAFGRGRLEGRWSLLFFGYTSCPDVCPGVLQTMRRVMATGQREPGVDLPQVVFVSVDPQRDGPERLEEYLEFFHPAFVGLSGEAAEIAKLAASVGAFYRRRDGEDGSRALDHSSRLFLVSPEAELFAVLQEPREPEAFVRRLARLQASREEG